MGGLGTRKGCMREKGKEHGKYFIYSRWLSRGVEKILQTTM